MALQSCNILRRWAMDKCGQSAIRTVFFSVLMAMTASSGQAQDALRTIPPDAGSRPTEPDGKMGVPREVDGDARPSSQPTSTSAAHSGVPDENPRVPQPLSMQIRETGIQVTAVPPNPDASGQGGWGNWGSPAYCPSGTMVLGFRTRAEPANSDNTALNAVQLVCGEVAPKTSQRALTRITSLEASWGNWESEKLCPNLKPAIGFAMSIRPYQGTGDDWAAASLVLICAEKDAQGKNIELISDAPAWGAWTANFMCPAGEAITGFRTKVEPYQGSGNRDDDTALNAMQVYCSRW
ncbi:hypothetical protein [Pseudomonas fluorescens]|uniref:hypothetical protein n=1 Tax=Pseudomonas fluorescens TaxID=294 RepID=UPI0018C86387|nr:hypothetical protein [Pseudomonas fluorescens]